MSDVCGDRDDVYTIEKLTAERDALKAELNRERASLSAACEASDKRAAALNREVIADNERLRAEQRRIGDEFVQVDIGRLEEIDRLRAELSVAEDKWLEYGSELTELRNDLAHWKELAQDHVTEAEDSLAELREAAEAYRRDQRNYARLDAILDKLPT